MIQHQTRLLVEEKRAKLKGFGLNFFIVLYSFYLLHSLVKPVQGGGIAIYILISVVLAALYSVSRQSLGFRFVSHSNSILKHTDKSLGSEGIRLFSKVYLWALVLFTLILGAILTESSISALFSADGLQGANRIFSSMLHPETSILRIVLDAMVQTIFIALVATAISLPLAFLGGFLTARNLMRGTSASMSVYYLLRFLFNFVRSVEPIIWAIIFSVWVGIGPFAGMLALMLHSIASLAKSYSEQIECIDQGPLEAIEATGANRVQVVWYAVVPQIVLPFLAFTIYRWDINIRMATIIGLVGGGGVGSLLIQYSGLARWNEVGTIVLVIAAVVWIMDYLSAKIREAIY